MAIHPVVYIEISMIDRKETVKFYENVFGWQTELESDMNYATFDPGEGVGGGFTPVTNEYPAGTVIVYIGTDDVTASLKKVAAAGGKVVVPESNIPGVGKFGLFKDPGGNLIGLFNKLTM